MDAHSPRSNTQNLQCKLLWKLRMKRIKWFGGFRSKVACLFVLICIFTIARTLYSVTGRTHYGPRMTRPILTTTIDFEPLVPEGGEYNIDDGKRPVGSLAKLKQVKRRTAIQMFPNSTIGQDMKYILLWNTPPIFDFYLGRTSKNLFNEFGCRVNACYVTEHKEVFDDIKKFHAIVFTSDYVTEEDGPLLQKAPNQKFIFFAKRPERIDIEDYTRMNNFFSWTWTFKLDSEFAIKPLIVRLRDMTVVAPTNHPKWIPHNKMNPAGPEVISSIRTKRLAAVWHITDCKRAQGSVAETFAQELKAHLLALNLTFDVYGECRPRDNQRRWLNDIDYGMIKRFYYFYMVFDTGPFAADYTGFSLVDSFIYNTVPVVYAGADYNKFLPPGSYINARALGPKRTAEAIRNAVANSSVYHGYLKWRSHYTIEHPHVAKGGRSLCEVCAALHDKNAVARDTVYGDFAGWWKEDMDKAIVPFVNSSIEHTSEMQPTSKETRKEH